MGTSDSLDQHQEQMSPEEQARLSTFGKELTRVGKTVRPSMYFRITSKEKILTYIENRGFSLGEMLSRVFSRAFAPVYAMLFLVAFVISSVIPVGVLNEVQASQVGSLTIDYGIVRVKRDGKEIVVRSGERLYIGDEIMVSEDAQASLQFIDNSSGVLSENSAIAITGVMINPIDVENSQVELALREGNFHAETGKKKAKDGSLLRIHTPSGTVAASKGSFAVAVQTGGKTEVTAYSDSVMVASRSTSPEEQIVSKEAGGTIAVAVVAEQPQIEASGTTGTGTVVIASEGTESTGTSAVVVEEESGTSVTEVNALRTELYFAELKLKQSYAAFQREDMDATLEALYDYQERLRDIEKTYFEAGESLAARGQYSLLSLLDVRRSSTLIIDIREMVVQSNALPVYRDTLLYLRRMIALETSMRQEIPVYLERQANKIQPHVLMHRMAQDLYPVMDELVALEKARSEADAATKNIYTADIEAQISLIANTVMKQQDSDARRVLLEDLLSVIPNTKMYTYMVLRFKIYFPDELHEVIDGKASQMK